MVVNTHYSNNLKAVMQVGKNYTDDKIQEVLDLVSDYNVNSQEVEQLSQSATAPNKDIRTTSLMVVGGNSVKYAPSTPSDDSVARLKVIPENTYKSQIDYIGGKTVKYNQLVQNGNFENNSYWSSYIYGNSKEVSNNECRIYGMTNLDISQGNFNVISGHKYLVSYEAKGNEYSTNTSLQFANSAGSIVAEQITTSYKKISQIITSTADTTRFYIFVYGNNANNEAWIRRVEIIDLTAIFGAGNEPSDVATAIPLLKASGYKLDGTDEYSTGKLKHAITTSVNIVSKNLFGSTIEDFEQGEILGSAKKVEYTLKPNTQYTLSCVDTTGSADSANVWFNGSSSEYNGVYFNRPRTTTTDSNGKLYIAIRQNKITEAINTYQLMLNEGSTALSFIPYNVQTLSIPSQVLADNRYGLGYDDNNYNKLDCNTKHLSGTRKQIDLGTINYLKNTTLEGLDRYYSTLPDTVSIPQNVQAKIKCNKLTETYINKMNDDLLVNAICIFNKDVYISTAPNQYASIQDFKTAMSGVILEYELNEAFDQDYSQYFTPNWNKVDLDNQYATCEMVVDEPIDMPNKVEYYGTIKDTLVDSIDIDNGGGDTSSVDLTDYTIESDGWSVSNTLFNYRAFREGNRHKVVGRVDLGSLNWTYDSINNFFITPLSAIGAVRSVNHLISNNYIDNGITSIGNDKSYYFGSVNIAFADSSYSSVEAFKTAMSGVYLVYELAEEVITPLNLPRNFYRIDTKQNGVTTFNNDNNQPCHNTLRYYYKEVKSNE